MQRLACHRRRFLCGSSLGLNMVLGCFVPTDDPSLNLGRFVQDSPHILLVFFMFGNSAKKPF